MKPPHDLPASLRWEIALNIGNDKNQNTEQKSDLDNIIKEKLHTSADFPTRVKPQSCQQPADECVQPFHTQNLVRDKLSNQEQHPPSLSEQQLLQVRLSMNALKLVNVSPFRE